MSEKKGLLPVVTESIGSAVQAELLQQEGYITEMLKRLQEDNPCIANFISQVAMHSSSEKRVQQQIAYCGLLVYRLLESQAEADKMNQEFGK